MAISCSKPQLELDKFVECPTGQASVSVKVCNPGDISGAGVNEIRTVSLPGLATTTNALVPAVPVPGEFIDGVAIWNDGGRPINISFDGGTTFHEHRGGEFLSQDVFGDITQIHINTTNGQSQYRLVLNIRGA